MKDELLKKLTAGLFKSHTTLQVRYRDLDTFNHVNNSVYPSYMEFGRLDYMKKYLDGLINWKDKGFILGTNHIVYLHPLFLYDTVHIYTGVGRVGNRSVTFVSLMTNGTKTVAVAYSVLVSFDFLKNQSIEVPLEWRKIFEQTDRDLQQFLLKDI